MIFRFVVRHFRWFGRIPLLPQVFDAGLLLVSALLDRGKVRAIERLEKAVCDSLRLDIAVHRFGGMGFFSGTREVAHVHGNGLVDAFVGRANRDQLIAANEASPHHVFPSSGWVSFWMRDETDVASGVRLIALAREHRGTT
jgi:hypothetical protein